MLEFWVMYFWCNKDQKTKHTLHTNICEQSIPDLFNFGVRFCNVDGAEFEFEWERMRWTKRDNFA